jgi:hypothetical protein
MVVTDANGLFSFADIPAGGSASMSTLTDVTLTSLASGDFLKYNGTAWINRTAANVRTDLGLVIGTNVQAYDADLTTYAGITPSANVQSVLSAADYAAIRTLLGVTTLPSYTGNDGKVLGLVSGSLSWVANGSGGMVYPSAGIAVSTGSAWGTSITDNSTNWNTAYTDRLKWDGGSTGLNASTGRTSLGATTVGSNLFTATNPSAITFLQVNADNTVTFQSASAQRTALGLGSLATASTINDGNWSGTDLSVANGGTGASTLTGIVVGNGTSAMTAVA